MIITLKHKKTVTKPFLWFWTRTIVTEYETQFYIPDEPKEVKCKKHKKKKENKYLTQAKKQVTELEESQIKEKNALGRLE